jgi:hypothetical protein
MKEVSPEARKYLKKAINSRQRPPFQQFFLQETRYLL